LGTDPEKKVQQVPKRRKRWKKIETVRMKEEINQ